MKICFVGHSFHKKTQSSSFFLDILRRLGAVTEFYSDPDGDPRDEDAVIRDLVGSRFDRYIFWQTELLAEKLLPFDLGPSILVPMYDSVAGKSMNYWERFVKYKFISFSRSHHEALQRLGCVSAYFQYFPDYDEAFERKIDISRLDAFFWERQPTSAVNIASVAARCRALGIGRLHIHAAPDFPDRVRHAAPVDDLAVSTSTWFARQEDYRAVAATPLFYFAPRERKGIGMVMLEAMARGQIVIAPDFPTSNEYIAHEVSGLLYDPTSDAAVWDVAAFNENQLAEMSRAARRKIVEGRRTWLMDIERLMSLVADDGRRWSTTDYSAHFARDIRTAARARMRHDH